jgi:hypothetical protein
MTEGQYIYLLQEREFVKTGELIYKIGRTKKEHYTRFNQYPNGSILLLHIKCDDCDCNEKDIIKLFKTKYKHRKKIGNEYFEGDSKEMMKDIFNVVIKIKNTEKVSNKEVDKEKEEKEEKKEKEIINHNITEQNVLKLFIKTDIDKILFNEEIRKILKKNKIIVTHVQIFRILTKAGYKRYRNQFGRGFCGIAINN